MDLYLKVRLACSEGLSQRAAARHFNISRDSVRKMLSFSSPPGYRREKAIKRPRLDGFTEIIDAWLDGDKDVHRSSATQPSGYSNGFETSMGSAAAIRSSRIMCASAGVEVGRCLFL